MTITHGTSEIDLGFDLPVSVHAYDGGVLVMPTTAVISAWNYLGGLIVDNQDMSIDNSNELVTYTIDNSLIPTVADHYRYRVQLEIAGVNYASNFYFHVMKAVIGNNVTSADLYNIDPNLENSLPTGWTNWQTTIDAAFQRVKDAILGIGDRRYLDGMIDGMQVQNLILYKSLEMVYETITQGVDDIWDMKRARYEKRYMDAFDNKKFFIDYSITDIPCAETVDSQQLLTR